jgi:predicted permease
MALRRSWTVLRRLLLLHAREDRALEDELAFHIAEETKLQIERGASPAEAARAARRAFGSVAAAKEETRGVWVSGATERLFQDFRFGCRIVTGAPLLLLSAVTLVALVIGGNTTVYSIVSAILSKPAPGIHAENLVTVSWVRKDGFVEPETSFANYLDLAAQSRALGPMLAYQYARVALGHEGGSNGIWAAGVSANYFQTLGVPIALGRGFTADDDLNASSGLIMVISDRAWRDYFASAPSAVGAAVFVSGLPATIVGVAAPGFRGTLLAPAVDAWVPIGPFARAAGGADAFASRRFNAGVRGALLGNFVGVVAQVERGGSLAQVRTELGTLWRRLQAQYPEVPRDTAITVTRYSATAGGNSLLSTQGTTFLAVFSVITALTLAIVCANVANLLLGRAAVRQRELALRQSLGASRSRLVRMLIAEGLVIALVACAAAYVFTRRMTGVIANLISPMVPPAVAQVIAVPDRTVAAYAATLALASMVIFTFAPALRAWRLPLLPALKAGEQAVVQGRSRLSSGLVVVQLALAVLLITSAGLATRSMVLFAAADLGFDPRSMLLATVNTNGAAVDPQSSAALVERLRIRLQAIPGVESVSYSSRAPFQGVRAQSRQRGEADTVAAEVNIVGPDYLRTHGLAPSAGRELAIEIGGAATPVVVTQALAERLWPAQNPIGHRLFYGSRDERAAEVVGVVPNVLFNGNRASGSSYALLPASADQRDPGERTMYLRLRGRLEAVAPAIGQAVRAEDPRVPLVTLRTLDAQLDESFWPVRALTMLLAAFALMSLVIAVIGQYAVVAFNMRRRIRDFGVRIALGASSRQILVSVVTEGLRLTALGLAVGFALSVLTGVGLSRVLYGITPTDPMTYGGVLLLLALVSLAACLLPAVRASRVNPMSTLRQE